MADFKGKVCVVTGAASGIGLACARRFQSEGAVVCGIDLKGGDDWQPLAEQGAQFHELDVRDFEAGAAAVADIVKKHQRIDALVTAAGVGGGGAVHNIDLAEWDRVVDINLKGTFFSCRAVLPTMLEQRAGAIVTLASVEGLEGTEGGSCYNASKGGVVLLTRNMAIDYGHRGIRVNAICPGFIRTPMFEETLGHEAMSEYRERIRRQHKLGRFGEADEIAAAARFLISDDASFITGQALAVDGGFSCGHSYGMLEMMGLD